MNPRVRAILLACATLTAAVLFSCTPYELRSVLDGPNGKALSISPSATAVPINNSISFAAAGGVGPYVYSVVSGGGSIDPATGVYSAPGGAGSAVIRVTDKTGKSVDATITIQAQPDYTVSFNVAIPWSGVVNTAITGTPKMIIQNLSANSGLASINWSVYLSTDKVLDGGDLTVDSGTVVGLPGGGSTSVDFSGTDWPGTPGLYFLIATVQSTDDSNITNNVVVAPHPCAIGNSLYEEIPADNNDGTGNPPPAGHSSSTGATLGINQTIAIEGVMDAYNQYDTYDFMTGAGTSQLNIRAMWGTGYDDINLWLWSASSTDPSTEAGVNSEPAAGTFDVMVLSSTVYYVSANFISAGSGSAGQKYVILVQCQ